MKILITGASGFIGQALIKHLTSQNHQVLTLVRGVPTQKNEIAWQPSAQTIDAKRLNGLDAAIHLAGENIAGGRWSKDRKNRIRSSRIDGTHLLAKTLAQCPNPPSVLISASAIGYYGDRGDDMLSEDSTPGTGFLPEVALAWEEATQPAIKAGIRTIWIRIGMVLDAQGGALAKMLLPFKFGLGGQIGSGAQYMSWITRDDLISAMCYLIQNNTLSGPFNAVSPHPVTNREFAKTLGHVLKRPTFFPVPAFVAKMALGEMAEALLLSSTRVLPTRLQKAGFTFNYPTLESALRHTCQQ